MYKAITRVIPEAVKAYLLRKHIGWKYQSNLAGGVRVNWRTALGKYTAIGKDTQIAGAIIGEASYVGNDCNLCNTLIGKYCSIGSRVRTNFGIHPARNFVSTHPAFFSTKRQAGFTFAGEQLFEEHKYIDKERRYVVEIGNDVWIGDGVSILDGIVIGDGAIVGAGAIVTRDIEPYSINAGVPARKIGQRFSQDQIDFLLRFKWWDKDYDWIELNAGDFGDIAVFHKKYEDDASNDR